MAVHFASPLRRALHDSAGVTMVEFALVGIAVFYLVMGMLEFGYIFTTYMSLTNMARDATRAAAAAGASSSSDTTVVTPACRSDSAAVPGNWTCSCTPTPPSSRTKGSLISCTATASVPVVVPLINVITGNNLALSAVSNNTSER